MTSEACPMETAGRHVETADHVHGKELGRQDLQLLDCAFVIEALAGHASHLSESPYWSMGQAKTSTLEGQNLARRLEGAAPVAPIVAQRTTKASARTATPTSAAMSSSSAWATPSIRSSWPNSTKD